jgi:hypothetical protein
LGFSKGIVSLYEEGAGKVKSQGKGVIGKGHKQRQRAIPKHTGAGYRITNVAQNLNPKTKLNKKYSVLLVP